MKVFIEEFIQMKYIFSKNYELFADFDLFLKALYILMFVYVNYVSKYLKMIKL